MTSTSPKHCSSCFVLFSNYEVSYGRPPYNVNCIRCAGTEIFTYATPDRETSRTFSPQQRLNNIIFPSYHVELIDNRTSLQDHLIQKITSLIDSILSKSKHFKEIYEETTTVHSETLDLNKKITEDRSKRKEFQSKKGEKFIEIIKQVLTLDKKTRQWIEEQEHSVTRAKLASPQSRVEKILKEMQNKQALHEQDLTAAQEEEGKLFLLPTAVKKAEALRKAVEEWEKKQTPQPPKQTISRIAQLAILPKCISANSVPCSQKPSCNPTPTTEWETELQARKK